MRRMVPLSIILVGFTAIVAQIILIREFLVVFYGNEIMLGIIFTSWFIAGMIGSWGLGKFTDRLKNRINVFSFCQFSLSILLPLSIYAVRSIKPFFNLGTGEMINFTVMALSSFIILGPICAMLGFMFSLGSRLYDSTSPISATKIGKVYILEAIGSILGGLLASFILVRLLNSLQIMVILGLLNIIGAIFLQVFSRDRQVKPIFLSLFLVTLISFIASWVFGGWDAFHRYSLKMQWKGYELLASRNSIYGNIAVTKRQAQRSFFYNGLHLFTVPDQLTSEEAVHFALLEHPHPKSVLLIGGGIGGLVREVLKHPIEKVDYIELDPLIIEMAVEYLPAEEYNFLKNQRVVVHNIDGRFFIKGTENKYDCVIVHLGNPYTAQLNRYYTVEFFQEVKRILKEGGVLSFALASSESYISRPLKDFLSSVYLSLKEVFIDVKIIPGDTAYFLSSNQAGTLTYDYQTLSERRRERNLDIKYVREYYLFFKLLPAKIFYTLDTIRRNKAVMLNYDFQPISYYYDLIFWSAHFKDSFLKRILEAANRVRVWQAVFTICGLTLLYGLFRIIKNKKLQRQSSLITLMATGFTQMSLQIIILLSFQIIYGYLFYKLGLMLTSFMVGLALGGFWMVRVMPKLKKDWILLSWLQGVICIYPLLLSIFLKWLSGSGDKIFSWIGTNILFPLLPIIIGFVGGAQFPLVNKIYLAKEKEIGKVAGLTYGIDLLGSCLGALCTAIFFIPILGIAQTCLLICGINLTVLTVLFLSLPRVLR